MAADLPALGCGMTAPHLTRPAAAEWFAARGFTHLTVRHLSDLADRGRGPRYSRLGKRAYYAESDLQAWLEASLRPSTPKARTTRAQPQEQT
jgi:hypothetical protein